MHDYKAYAALAYARANRLNHTVIDSPQARLGIIASGKSYLDVLEALEELGIDEAYAAHVGIRLFKVAMPWPLEPDSVREFAQGLEEILVVEEKRQIVEYQLKEQLYNWRDDVRPRVIGKFDEKGEWVHPRGEWLLTSKADFSVAQIARVIASRIARFYTSVTIKERLAFLDAKEAVLRRAVSTPPRPAWYCAGCPHNTSTRVPAGSLALAGIGCHVMAASIYPEQNKTTTHMGSEGAPWIGQAPFSKRSHIFANLGDGTYFHSGSLAIRAAIAAGVNITYKILYNDAVAMTGGQPVDGKLSAAMIAQQVAAEGVTRIALVVEDLAHYEHRAGLPTCVTLHDRAELDAVQRELRELPGRGLELTLPDGTWRLGRTTFATGGGDDGAVLETGAAGETLFTRDGAELARLRPAEEFKADAAGEIAALRRAGYELHLLSGDAQAKVDRAALALGLPADRAEGDLDPEAKAARVRALDRHDTLMVGDGLNDSPSFAAAWCAATPAVDRPVLPGKADFFFLGDGIAAIGRTLWEARRLRRVVRDNLVIAIAYNLAAVGCCAAGLVTPVAAAIFMPASSVAVVTLTTVRISRGKSWM